MKKQILHIILVVGIALLINACDFLKDEDSEQEQAANFTNTLDQNLGGTQGAVGDYFYNFENDVDASFFRYNPNLMANYETYLDYYSLFGVDPTRMSFRTFPDHLVSMTPSDEAEFTERHYIDSLSVADSVVYDSIQMTSTPFKNLERLEWNLLAEPILQRYKLVNSDWVVSDTMLFYNDTFDVSAYWAVVDTPFIDNGLLFVDSSEWNDTDYVFISDDPIRFLNTFEFIKQQLSDDSLVFRSNTDCNDNGQWDGSETTIADYNGNGIYEVLYEYSDNNNNGEYDAGDDVIQDFDGNDTISVAYEFVDRGNGIWDPQEPYYDIDSSGTHTIDEPYQDRNCNNKWDDAEEYVDGDGSGTYSDGESFTDRGNNIYDEEEEYSLKDMNSDGVSDTLLYLTGDKPDNLIVDWTDPSSPEVLLEIHLGDDVVNRWGTTYTDVIEEVDFYDLKQQYADDVDSLITLFTREEVGHVNSTGSSLSPDDYYITKSEWTKTAGGQTERFYNYHIFHEPDHLNQIVYPSYFLPVGFYFSPNDIEDGFWHKRNLESEVLYYTSNGYLRDGEMVDTAYYDTTEIAVYFIEKSFQVESASIVVPAGHRASMDQPASDTTFSDCFMVTQNMTMTMVGSGVDFGQKTISWLAKNKGLVKSEVYIRWTEHPYDSDYTQNNSYLDTTNQAWVGLNRIELTSVDISSENNVFRKLTRPVKSVTLKDVGDRSEFDFDPFYISAQSGIHTLDLRELDE
ncbi:MAG: hypothetical protein QF780_08770 [Candidatus Marinimicrobia bacterium]|nr:hypothetical protein [Candidatus Neomarinimicrobiota bacterium]